MPSSHLILCRPLLLLPPIPPSIRVFSNESLLHIRWPKFRSFSLSISPSNEHPGLVRSPFSPRYSQDSSPIPQLKSINSSALSILYSPSVYIQFSSVAQSCLTLCDPMNCSTPGLPVHHQLPEFTQTHVHRVRDAIQLSHPLSSPSPPAPNPSQYQSFFQ